MAHLPAAFELSLRPPPSAGWLLPRSDWDLNEISAKTRNSAPFMASVRALSSDVLSVHAVPSPTRSLLPTGCRLAVHGHICQGCASLF